ncbi:MAG: zinc metalloprotease [Gammaproteobacteria bacterium]|nr:MAG: zinc metalloprotease [Gammaproteobacteria bacterium]
MEEILYSIFGFLVAVGVLVTVHEWGHYAAARLVGVRVLKFSIGFGRSVWERSSGVDGTTYAIGIVPLGGYVKMLGEGTGDVLPGDAHRAFDKKPLWARAFIVSAGPVANLVLAVMIYWLVSLIGVVGLPPVVGSVQPDSVGKAAGFRIDDRILTVNAREVKTWGEHRLFMLSQVLAASPLHFEVEGDDEGKRRISVVTTGLAEQMTGPALFEKMLGIQPRLPTIPAVVGDVVPDSPAALAGLVVGDHILAIEGHKITDWRELVQQISTRADQEVVIEIDRQGMKGTESGSARGRQGGRRHGGGIGFAVMDVGEIFGDLPKASTRFSGAFKRLGENMVDDHGDLADGLSNDSARHWKREFEWPQISIGHFAGQSARVGLVPFLVFLALVSVSLGVLICCPYLAGRRTFTVFIDRRGDGAPVPPKSHAGRTGARWRLFGYLV